MVLLAWFLKSSLVLAAALLLGANKRLTATTRHLVLVIAMIATPFLLVGEMLAPAPLVHVQAPEFLIEVTQTIPAVTSEAAIEGSSDEHYFMWDLPALYLMICLALLIVIGMRFWHAYKLVRGLPAIVEHPIKIRVGRGGHSPFVWGLLNPCIVVPAQWCEWSEEKQRSVLLHEYAHLRRQDTLVALFITLVCVVCWIHPLMWAARRRCLLLAEQACDDAVINQGVLDTTYATHLLEISRMRAQQLAPSMARLSQLSSRIKVLLDESTRRKPMTITKTMTLVAVATLFVTAVFNVGIVGNAQAGMDNVRSELVTKLATAQVHIDDEKFTAAQRVIGEARELANLNANEVAQIQNMNGYRLFREGKYPEAIGQYRKVLEADTIPSAMRLTTLYTLAQLNFVESEYERAISYMRRWVELAEDPGAVPLVFIAQTYYQMQQFDEALVEMERALSVARSKGTNINKNWLKLRDYLVQVQNGEATGAPPHTGVDGDYYPIAKAAPVYPSAAKQHKIEGYVVVEFSVAADGSTASHKVVESVPPEIFDRAAVAAVKKFKYKPRIENGQPVMVSGIRNKITFAL